jgi:hypothetical protein
MVHAVVLGAAGISSFHCNLMLGCSSIAFPGGIGQPVSLLLKQNPAITKVATLVPAITFLTETTSN